MDGSGEVALQKVQTAVGGSGESQWGDVDVDKT